MAEQMNNHLEAIEELMVEILADYGNTAYLRLTQDNQFELARSSPLWGLWYADDYLSVRNMERRYEKVKHNEYSGHELYKELLDLRDKLNQQFFEIENEFRR
ncbi:MAG: hypothetical protein KBS74_05090 [Clostridiales bacterium]|nr:hypothetical protein [Candidatus Cacconaster stercorequi]